MKTNIKTTTDAVRRIIFLDFDGVLRPLAGRTDRDGWAPESVGALNYLTDNSGAEIVVSSTWRNDYSLRALTQLLRSKEVRGEIVGTTPKSYAADDARLIVPGVTRGEEIRQWLEKNGPAEFVIIDDGRDLEPFNHRFVRTDSREGLKRRHADQALRFFSLDSSSQEEDVA